jgi:SAM-dependent methyltransferase
MDQKGKSQTSSELKPTSLLHQGRYSLDWVKDFYVQSDIWWGADAGEKYYPDRLLAIQRLCGPGMKQILELGAGSGAVAARMAQMGHTVVAVELTEAIQVAQALDQTGWPGSLTALEADFYTVELEGVFDLICYWDGFGVGSDADQRRLLHRIGREWLAPNGSVLIDIFCPFRFARHADTEEILPPLEGVPGSVEMRHRCHFDPLYCRWIDEWQPTATPVLALAQIIRCYSPPDFVLLLEGSGLELERIEVDGDVLEFTTNRITPSGPLLETYSYLVKLRHTAANYDTL